MRVAGAAGAAPASADFKFAVAVLVTATVFALVGAGPAVGSDIVYVCGKDLCRVDGEGKGRQRLTRDGERSGAYSRPSISLEGRRLAFKRGNPGRVWTSDSRLRRRTRVMPAPDGARDATQFDVELSPSGKQVAWVETRINFGFGGTDYRRYLGAFDGTGARQVASNGGRPLVGFTHDGVIIREGDPRGLLPPDRAFCTPDPATKTNGVCTERSRLLAADPDRTLRGPVMSPNGRLLAATASPGSATRVIETEPPGAIGLFDGRTGALVRNLTAGPNDSHPAFSPDGRFVAFQRGSSIWRVRASGGRAKRIVARGVQPAWGR